MIGVKGRTLVIPISG
jgi:hypothetical protein